VGEGEGVMGEGMGDDAAHSGSWLKKLGKAAEAGWSHGLLV